METKLVDHNLQVIFLSFFTEIATLTHKFSSVTIFRNKTVRYAARMHAIIACQMVKFVFTTFLSGVTFFLCNTGISVISYGYPNLSHLCRKFQL